MEHKSTAKNVKENTFHSMLSSLGINFSRRLLSQIWKIFKGLNNFVNNNRNMNVKVIYCYASEGKLIAAGVKKISSSLPSLSYNQLSSLRAFLPPPFKHQTLVTSEGSNKSKAQERWRNTKLVWFITINPMLLLIIFIWTYFTSSIKGVVSCVHHLHGRSTGTSKLLFQVPHHFSSHIPSTLSTGNLAHLSFT